MTAAPTHPRRQSARRRPAAVLVGALLAAAALPAWARLQEESLRVPVQVRDRAGQTVSQDLVVTLWYDTATPTPRRVALIAHGRPADDAGRQDLGRVRYPEAARFFAQRGDLVVLPTRIGYGATGGPDVEASGNCGNRDFAPALTAASTELLATLDAVTQRPDARAQDALLVGHSFGGIAALQAAAQRPRQVAVVVDFSGGAGADPVEHPGAPCSVAALSAQLQQIGARSRVPSLWLYAANDRSMGSEAPQQWLAAYRQAGGVADFLPVRPVGVDGHTLFAYFPAVWKPLVAPWLDAHRSAATPSAGR